MDQKVLGSDEQYEAAQAMIEQARKQRAGEVENSEPAAPEPAAASAEPSQPAAEPAQPSQPDAGPDEPFKGYRDLPENIRAEIDRLKKEREELEQERSKLRGDFNALHQRLAPTQRQVEELRRQLNERRQPEQQIKKASIDDWIAKQPQELRDRYKEFPEEARLNYDIARGVVSEQVAEIETRVAKKLEELELRAERQQLAKEHPDWQQFGFDPGPRGEAVPRTQEAASLLAWVGDQSPNVQRAFDSNSAADLSEVLSLYKWERDNPGLRDAMQDQEFRSFVANLPPAIASALGSPRKADRQYILQMFLATVDQPDPSKTAAVDKIAAKRAEQQRPSPSIRQSPAPVQAAASASTGDANWDQAQAFINQARKSRNRQE